jgi:hypothetical protein
MSNDFSKLKLEGATAAQAVDCMRKDAILPRRAYFERPSHSIVEMRENGDVVVDEFGSMNDAKDKMLVRETAITPASGGNLAEIITPEVEAVGPGVEPLRQRAIACAVKGIGGP